VLGTSLDLDDLGRPPVVVGLSAHPDDLEIGAGGTLLTLLRSHPTLQLHSVVLTGDAQRASEAESAVRALSGGRATVTALGLRDGHLPADWGGAKDALRAATDGLRPDLVLAPSSDDSHQDHRLVGELAWQLFRDTLVLEYEVVKWEGDLVRRNAYVALDDEVAAAKTALLREHFPSQADKPWYDEDVFRALMRLRGVECGARWAEAFHARKTLIRT
jgi:LmbE family N-acetylglucosaminyl deacetylase